MTCLLLRLLLLLLLLSTFYVDGFLLLNSNNKNNEIIIIGPVIRRTTSRKSRASSVPSSSSSSSSSSSLSESQQEQQDKQQQSQKQLKSQRRQNGYNNDYYDYEDTLIEMESERLYGLGCKQSDLSDFCNKLERGTLNLFPEYQRSFVWEPSKSSRLLVTVLCNRFLPPLVLHETSKGIFDVVDGKQRLTTLLGFYMNRKDARLPTGDIVLRDKMLQLLPGLRRLSKLDESYESLNGLSFDDLSLERQRAFESYSISYMVIPLDTPRADVFEVYEDINSGGTQLTQQQVRRAVFHGPYMKLIDELREHCTDFHAIRAPNTFIKFGLKNGKTNYQTCKKDSDGELILRAMAFRNNGENFKPSLKKFLNRELEGSEDYYYSTTTSSSSSRSNNNYYDRNNGDNNGGGGGGRDGSYGNGSKMTKTQQQRQYQLHQKLEEQKKEFEIVMKVARQVFGEEMAFRKKNIINNKGSGTTSAITTTSATTISKTMWDAKYCAIAELLKVYKEVDFVKCKDKIVDGFIKSIESGFFSLDDEVTSSTKFVTRKEHLKDMFQTAMIQQQQMQQTNGTSNSSSSSSSRTLPPLNINNNERRRLFPTKLRMELYQKQNGLCGICYQTIDQHRLDDGTYVHIDHILPYSQGGKTTATTTASTTEDDDNANNAQLTHSVCNLHKGNRIIS